MVSHQSSLANSILDSAQGYSIQSHLETDCAVPDSGSLDILYFWNAALAKQILHDDIIKYKTKKCRKTGSQYYWEIMSVVVAGVAIHTHYTPVTA